MTWLEPSPNRARPPRFHEMEAVPFEELCCALLDKEPEIRTAELYHAQRQAQLGIDVLGRRLDQDIEVISCKCYAQVRKGQVPEWCNDFLKYWDEHWSHNRVRRFILAVSADIKSKQRQEEIEEQRAQFAKRGVDLEIWGPRQLQEKLRPHYGIAAQYLGDAIAEQICGRQQLSVVQPTLDAIVASQLGRTEASLATELGRRLDDIRDGLKRGNGAATDRALNDIQADPVRWAALGPDDQARILRLRGSRALDRGEIEEAERLADQVDCLTGSDDGRRLRAAAAARRGDPAAGLRILADPRSDDDRRLAASLLIAAGQPREALQVLPEANADDAALRSLALAATSELKSALSEVERAEQLDPSLLVVRRVGVAVRFAAAMSQVVPFEAGPWPEPMPLGLVREDDPARELLRAAADIAAAALREPGLDRDDRHDFETWRLACLANQRELSPEAEAYARDLLGGGRPHPGAAIWSLTRGYEFDRPRVARGLEDLLEAGRGEPTHLTVLLALQLDMGRTDRASRALQRFGDRFASSSATELLTKWQRIVDAHQDGDLSPADLPAPLRLQNLIEDAQRSDQWEEVGSFVREVTEGSPDGSPVLAVQGLRALAAADQWELVAPFVPFLVDHVQTAEAITLACLATYDTAGPAPALELLEAHTDAFPSGVPPLRLRRLRAECLRRLGRLSEAAQLADALALGGELPDMVAAIEVRLAAGDVADAIPYFRKAAERSDLPPEQALRYARAARPADPVLAADLWRQALASDLPERLAGAAASIAFELGMDAEVGPLLATLAARAQAGDDSVRVGTLEDMMELLRQRREQAEQAYSNYLTGQIPVHVLVEEVGVILADLFARSFAGLGGPLLIRDGSRRSNGEHRSPIERWRLRLDITGLLTAHHLDLLDLLEQYLAPLELPNALPGALREMSLRLGSHQASQLQAQRALVAAVESGRVTVEPLGSLAEPARVLAERSGALVDYTPGPEDQELGHQFPFANPRRVFDAIAASGSASDEVLARGRRELGSMAVETPLGPDLRLGQELAFAKNTLQVFAAAGLLDALTQSFRVTVDAEWVTIARDEVAEAERQAKVAAGLDRLGDRLARGIQRGTYTVLPEPPSGPKDSGIAAFPHGPALDCLIDLVRSPPVPDSMIWVDDRFVTRFPAIEFDGIDTPLVGVYEVLEALRAGGLLDDGAYFDRLRRLREAGGQFLLPQADEVLHHLDRAAMQDRELIETPGLRTLRRSFAAAVLLEDQLRLDPSDEREARMDEALVLRDLWRLPAAVLGALWHRETNQSRTRACAEWVQRNIVVDHLKRVPLSGAEADRRRLHTLHLASLITDTLQIKGPDPDIETARRRAFLDWLNERILEPRLTADPVFAQEIAAHLKELMLRVLGTDDTPDAEPEREASTRALLARFILLLPERLAVPLVDDPEVSSKVPVARRPTIAIGGLVLPADTFFAAAAEAIESGSASISTPSGMLLRLEWQIASTPTLVLSGALEAQLEEPGMDLLRPDPAARRACLKRHPEWIDRPPAEAERKRAEIVARSTPHERMLALDDELTTNPEYRYRRLAQALTNPAEGVPASLFEPPAADDLLRHLRIDGEEAAPLQELLSRATRCLVDEFGPTVAFSRVAGIPVPTPDSLHEGFAELDPTRVLLLDNLAVQVGSPLRQARLIELLRAHGAQPDRVTAGLDRLLENVEVRLEGMLALLRWTERRFECQAQWRQLPRPLRLVTVWAHADRVADILLATTSQPDEVAPTINGWHPSKPVPWLLRDPADESEPSSPSVVSPPTLLLGLVDLALGDEVEAFISHEHRDAILACISNRRSDGGCWPYMQLFWPDGSPDSLDSFLGKCGAHLCASLDVDGLGDRLSPDFAAAVAAQAIDTLAHAPGDADAWKLLLVVRRHQFAPIERERIRDLLRQLDLKVVVAADEQTGVAVARWASQMARLLDDEVVIAGVLSQLAALTTRARERAGEAVRRSGHTNSEADIVDYVSDAAAQLCRSPRAERVAERLAQAARVLASTSPQSALIWRKILERLVSEFPYIEGAALWPPLVELRARSDLPQLSS